MRNHVNTLSFCRENEYENFEKVEENMLKIMFPEEISTVHKLIPPLRIIPLVTLFTLEDGLKKVTHVGHY